MSRFGGGRPTIERYCYMFGTGGACAHLPSPRFTRYSTKLAEYEGFEPSGHLWRPPVFETGRFNHSRNIP